MQKKSIPLNSQTCKVENGKVIIESRELASLVAREPISLNADEAHAALNIGCGAGC